MLKLLIIMTVAASVFFTGVAVHFFKDKQPIPGTVSIGVSGFYAYGAWCYDKYELHEQRKEGCKNGKDN